MCALCQEELGRIAYLNIVWEQTKQLLAHEKRQKYLIRQLADLILIIELYEKGLVQRCETIEAPSIQDLREKRFAVELELRRIEAYMKPQMCVCKA